MAGFPLRHSIWKRLAADLLWVVLTAGFTLAVSYLTAQDKDVWAQRWRGEAWLWVTSGAMGLVLGEHRWLWRWIVSTIRAARILIREDECPEEFIFPFVADMEFFPDRSTNQTPDYIILRLTWLSMLYRKASIEDIRGSLSIDGGKPDEFQSVEPLSLKPHDWTHPDKGITVTVKHYNLQAVTDMRLAKRAKGTLALDLNYRLDGKLHSTSISYKYRYVD